METKPRFSIGFFFLSLGLLITLITSVISALNLIFSTLDKKFPDVLNNIYQYGYATYSFEGMRVALATLIIFFPVFLIVSYFWGKFVKRGIGHLDEVIKKWLVYIILFLSALTIAIDLVCLVKYFVSGEITTRFIYKVISAFVVAGIIGKYFFYSEIWHKENLIKKLNKYTCPILGILIIIFVIVWSFSVMGSPAKQRLLRLDDKRVEDLQNIQYQVINYWQQKEKLPMDLKVLVNPLTGYSLPVPPLFDKGEKYEYSIKGPMKFELCATFALPMPKGWQEGYRGAYPMDIKVSSSVVPQGGVNESWNHEEGKTCYERIIDKDFYPPFSKIKN